MRLDTRTTRVATQLSEADLSFLDEKKGEEEAEGEPILLESFIVEGLPQSEKMAMEVSSSLVIDISISRVTPSIETSSGPSVVALRSPDSQDEIEK